MDRRQQQRHTEAVARHHTTPFNHLTALKPSGIFFAFHMIGVA